MVVGGCAFIEKHHIIVNVIGYLTMGRHQIIVRFGIKRTYINYFFFTTPIYSTRFGAVRSFLIILYSPILSLFSDQSSRRAFIPVFVPRCVVTQSHFVLSKSGLFTRTVIPNNIRQHIYTFTSYSYGFNWCIPIYSYNTISIYGKILRPNICKDAC